MRPPGRQRLPPITLRNLEEHADRFANTAHKSRAIKAARATRSRRAAPRTPSPPARPVKKTRVTKTKAQAALVETAPTTATPPVIIEVAETPPYRPTQSLPYSNIAELLQVSSPTIQLVQGLQSSPPPIELEIAPKPQVVTGLPILRYIIEVSFTVRVNSKFVVRSEKTYSREDLWLSAFEDKVEEMRSSKASGIEGRDCTVRCTSLSYRAITRGAIWKAETIEDFGDDVSISFLDNVDRHVVSLSARSPVELVQMRLEQKLECNLIGRAFSRSQYANEPSSDKLEILTALESSAGNRTKQQIVEGRMIKRAEEKAERRAAQVEAIRTAHDHVGAINNRWRCTEEAVCTNRGGYCYVPFGQMAHYQIKAVDIEAWAQEIVIGTTNVSVESPPIKLLQHWREDEKRERDERREAERLDRAWRVEETRRRQQQQSYFLPPQLPAHAYAWPPSTAPAPPPPAPSIWPLAATNDTTNARYTASRRSPVSSSPVSGRGCADDRTVVRQFFQWLIAQQPEDDQEDYSEAARVAIDQRWTVEDIRAMSNPKGDLYTIAMGFGLKDGVIRHLREELRLFKPAYRARGGSE
ncbi:hypothetical protein PMIN01_12092 [Paraphaeosphaeria minitans]|uniref:Uncharacterized protein n=1 Tax=Paraphaeosphaeria minitans TaxID=565426 RepID=A0A9P6G9I5_9PLEO|nr:hypothetical protein PMIN01_12092 [Paraphaeosphaeria minitans]